MNHGDKEEARQRQSEEFQSYRPLLIGLGYRLLGSMWDAEDVVQEASLRWAKADRAEIRQPRGFLVTVVTRLALDHLKSARVAREAYVGPWLPEPVATDSLGPLDTVELRDSVAYATMHMMERLTPPERAVFVLREAFVLPYEEIASIIGATVVSCRQLSSRAVRKVRGERERFSPPPSEHRKLLVAFLRAASTGDTGSLLELLSEDVTAWNDGGGNARAARRPIRGREAVISFVNGLGRKYDLGTAVEVEANGGMAIWLTMGNQEQLVTCSVRDGRIHEILGVLNPEKLLHMRPTLNH